MIEREKKEEKKEEKTRASLELREARKKGE